MDITAVAKPLLLELLKDPEIQKAVINLSDNDNCDHIDNWMDNNASDKISNHLENKTDIADLVNDCVSNLSFDVSVS